MANGKASSTTECRMCSSIFDTFLLICVRKIGKNLMAGWQQGLGKVLNSKHCPEQGGEISVTAA